jgi:membrane-bound serine protease (ClpP class)
MYYFLSPDLAFVLMLIGILGLLFEFSTPGSLFPGIVGIISLVLSIYSFSFFQINYFGLSLILFALVLLILEIKIISYGILTLFGLLSFSFGAYYLIDEGSSMHISISIIIISVFILLIFTVFLLYLGLKAQKRKRVSGVDALIGQIAIVTKQITPLSQGEIKYMGELWRASSNQTIASGEKVTIIKVENLTCFVNKISH